MFRIGSVVAIEDPSTFKVSEDDRIQNVPVIGGVYLEDLGLIDAGKTYDVTLTIAAADYDVLRGYRLAGTAPAMTDHRGNSLGSRAFRIKGKTYVEGCDLVEVELEILKAVS